MTNSTMKPYRSSRVVYLDIARGLATLFMFTQHCMLVHEVSGGESMHPLSLIFVLLGTAPAAPVFMLIMGVFLMKSAAPLQKNIIRGLKLLALGYLLNLLRFTLPLTLVSIDGFASLKGETPLDLLFVVDILQFAGLSFIIGSLIKKFINQYSIVLITLAILLGAPYLWGRLSGIPVFSLFWGEGKNVYFPFFPWIVYPLLGMFLSPYLLDLSTFRTLRKKMPITGGVLVVLSAMTFRLFPTGDYCRSGAAIHLLIIGFIFLWLPVCDWLAQRLDVNGRLISTLVYWSKNVTVVYFIQWVLFGWSMILLDANKQNPYTASLVGLVVLVITHLLCKLYVALRYSKKLKHPRDRAYKM